MNNLTDRAFWKEYWSNYQYEQLPSKMFFDKYFQKTKSGASFIEIGGFPGTISLYFHKKYKCKVTLLDFYIDEKIVRNMEKANNLPEGIISCIESDFFKYEDKELYDIVFSSGFIEHFDDSADVIRRHVRLLAPEGQLLIVLPNFKGLNGWIQKCFDKENFEAHNLKSMSVDYLKKVMHRLDLEKIEVNYTRKPIIWVEPKPTISKFVKLFVKMLSYFIKLFPIKGRFLSPYIVISAKKGKIISE